MASLIPGYEYDIFISYRQKDNKGDRWVSEFVEALKTELESTFKEEISVYFDINPHDGLLETHDVDASLKNKLKCLVFIPVISRTYCDPKSFAWEHEFKAFVEKASQDQFGLKVRLPGGNVATRILPARIYDLDNADIKQYESILGGVLRGIDFIYKSAGVNRPLRSKEENPHDNLNHTIYRDQINKVGNAIREIISGLLTEATEPIKEKIPYSGYLEEIIKEEKKEKQGKPARLRRIKLLSGILITAILVMVAIIVFPKILKPKTLDNLTSSGKKISVAVMPFQNLTNDSTLNRWQEGIQEILTYTLANSGELGVRQTGSIKSLIHSSGLKNYASLSLSEANKISQELDVNYFVCGKIIQSKKAIRLYAQLVASNSKEVFKAFQIEGSAENILTISDSLSRMVEEFIILSILKKKLIVDERHIAITNSPEALSYYMRGQEAFGRWDLPAAREWYFKAVDIDSNFVDAGLQISNTYENQGLIDEGRKWCLRFYKKRDMMPPVQKILIDYTYSIYFETPNEEIKYIKQLQQLDDLLPTYYFLTGVAYLKMFQWDKAIPELEKALETNIKLNPDSPDPFLFVDLGRAYRKTGQLKKCNKLFRKAERYFPDNQFLAFHEACLALSEGDTTEANQYIEKLITILKNAGKSDADIEATLANLYDDSGKPEKAGEYYRKALSLEPDSLVRMISLAYILIDKDLNVMEGLELVDKVLALKPDNYSSLHWKGWGFYKLGKYKEALELLEKSNSLKPIYNHRLFLHLDAAKKTVAGQR